MPSKRKSDEESSHRSPPKRTTTSDNTPGSDAVATTTTLSTPVGARLQAMADQAQLVADRLVAERGPRVLHSSVSRAVVTNAVVTYGDEDFEYEGEAPAQVYTLTLVNITTGLSVDEVIDSYVLIPDLLQDRVYIISAASKAYVGFSSREGFLEASTMVCEHGTVYLPAGYDPLADHGIFYRCLIACRILKHFSEKDLMSIFLSLDAPISSAKIKGDSNFVTVYFVNEQAWKTALSITNLVVSRDSITTAMRVVTSYAATSNREYAKFFVGNLPSNHSDALRRFFVGRWGVNPEIFALMRKADSGRTLNCGYIITCNSDAIEKLAHLTHKERSVKGKLITVAREAKNR